MSAKVVILAQFEVRYYIRGTLKRLMGVLTWLMAWFICLKALWSCVGYYIRGTLKRLTDVVDWPKAWWICTRNPCPRCLAGEEMPTKVMILAQFDHGYYIHGTLKWLMGALAWLKAWWIRFDHGYYIRGTLKWLADVFAQLKAWWIRVSVKQVTDSKSMPLLPWWRQMPTKVMILAQFEHRYYIRGTLKWLTGVLAWLKAWWIRVGVKQVADQKSMPLLPRWRGNACKSRDFGSV
ncbi:hypothetical protein C8R44DRAFT_738420 [Mycena epipterygia]|nr:hypothetical protein C8R44DRAFT_738420 [Mycena epipterygia]